MDNSISNHNTYPATRSRMASAPSSVREVGRGGGRPHIIARRSCREVFIYCLSDGDVVKVGSSYNPSARLAALRQQTGRPLVMARAWNLGRRPRGVGFIVEGHAHAALGRHGWCGHEWYSIPLADALSRIDASIEYMRRLWAVRWPGAVA